MRACFPNVTPTFPHVKHCFQCQFLFPICKLCLRYTAGNVNKNQSMQAVAKILRTRASEHSSNFCKQFEQRPNFESTFKLDGTIQTTTIIVANSTCKSGSFSIWMITWTWWLPLPSWFDCKEKITLSNLTVLVTMIHNSELHFIEVTPHHCRGSLNSNCEKELPKKPVGRQLNDRLPTVYRQLTNRLPTG